MHRDRPARALSLLSVAGTFSLLWMFFAFSADDAYIVARYARNLADAGELVFNRGEYINALTSPLDVALYTILTPLPIDPVTGHKLVGALCLLATLALGAARFRREPNAQATYLVLVGLFPPVALWAVGGLETPVLGLVLCALTLLCTQPGGSRRLLYAAVLSGVAFLARHDSILYTGVLLLWTARRLPLGRRLATLGVAAVLPLAWLAFARGYYGDFLPTSFFLKGPSANPAAWRINAIYLMDFVVHSGVLFVAGASVFLTRSALHVRDRAGVHAGLLAGCALYGLTAATGHMMFAFRLFVPFVPVLALVCADRVADTGDRDGGPTRGTALLSVILCAVIANHGATAVTMNRYSMNPTRVGEYRNMGLGDYRSGFLDLLPEAARAISSDWASRSGPLTFA